MKDKIISFCEDYKLNNGVYPYIPDASRVLFPDKSDHYLRTIIRRNGLDRYFVKDGGRGKRLVAEKRKEELLGYLVRKQALGEEVIYSSLVPEFFPSAPAAVVYFNRNLELKEFITFKYILEDDRDIIFKEIEDYCFSFKEECGRFPTIKEVEKVYFSNYARRYIYVSFLFNDDYRERFLKMTSTKGGNIRILDVDDYMEAFYRSDKVAPITPVLDTFVDKGSDMTFVCEKHGEFVENALVALKHLHVCPQCKIDAGVAKYDRDIFIEKARVVHGDKYNYDKVDYISSIHQSVVDYILSIYEGEVLINHRGILSNNRELDIYIPEHNLAIEVNGIYFHRWNMLSSENGRTKYKKLEPGVHMMYHYDKSMECEEQGIRLIHVWEFEWNDPVKRMRMESVLRGALGLSRNFYNARDCYVRVIGFDVYRSFVEENSIYGYAPARYRYGLFHKKTEELLMVWGLSSTWNSKSKRDLELVRSATLDDTVVRGGQSKMLVGVDRLLFRSMGVTSLTYFVDWDHYSGTSVPHMKLNGKSFEFAGYSGPSGRNWWVAEGVLKYREPSRHREIMQLIADEDIWVIYNAGTKKYVLDIGYDDPHIDLFGEAS